MSEFQNYNVQENLDFYLTSYKELFNNSFNYVLLHKYYKDFLEEVMPIVSKVNEVFQNGPVAFYHELYSLAKEANDTNKKIIDRILTISSDDEIFNALEISRNNDIFEVGNARRGIRSPHETKQFNYSKEYWDNIKNYFIKKEEETKLLLKDFEEEDIEDLEQLINTMNNKITLSK